MSVSYDVIESSRWWSFVLFVIFSVSAAMSWRMSLSSTDLILYGAVMSMFSFLAIYSAIAVFRPERLNVTPEGFSITPTIGATKPIVRWNEVSGFEVQRVRNSFFFQVAYRARNSLVSERLGMWWQVSAPDLANYLERCRQAAIDPVVEEEPTIGEEPLSAMSGLGVGVMIVGLVMAAGFTFPFMRGRRGAGPMIDWAGLEPKQQAVFVFIWVVCAALGLIGFGLKRAGRR